MSSSDSSSASNRQNSDNDEWNSDEEKEFFEHLSDISLGISHVATGLWLRSWGRDLPDDDDDSQSQPQRILQRIAPPKLPHLTKDDRYILFSLCFTTKQRWFF